MEEISDYRLYLLGRLLHESRMKECYGNWQMYTRPKWPATFKEYRAQQQAGQSWIDQAIAQVRAIAPYVNFAMLELEEAVR
ncbi:MAG TPA: hypothetical protein VMT20_15390 [Terriglobia bacterium]|nr:hypothetical protein [Terriglobia bacterium]